MPPIESRLAKANAHTIDRRPSRRVTTDSPLRERERERREEKARSLSIDDPLEEFRVEVDSLAQCYSVFINRCETRKHSDRGELCTHSKAVCLLRVTSAPRSFPPSLSLSLSLSLSFSLLFCFSLREGKDGRRTRICLPHLFLVRQQNK
jgi:hypothetical protein